MAWQNAALFEKFKFNAWYIQRDKDWHRFFSHALLHADWGHLLINMFVLWSFANVVLEFFTYDFGTLAGSLLFVGLYVGGIFFSTIYDFFKYRNDIYYNAVGASGAVAAVVFASIVLYPMGSIRFLFIPVDIPSWVFGLLYLAYSAYMGKRGGDNIGHNAHFWGSVFGIVYTLLINPNYLNGFLRQQGLI
jgi:membrane associated rhomboid family serine protease